MTVEETVFLETEALVIVLEEGVGSSSEGSAEDEDIIAGEDLLVGEVVVIESVTDSAVLAESLLSEGKFLVYGIVTLAALVGNTAKVRTIRSVVSVKFVTAPNVSDNGKEAFLSSTPGRAGITNPGLGHCLYRVGWIRGANGADTILSILFDPDLIVIQ